VLEQQACPALPSQRREERRGKEEEYKWRRHCFGLRQEAEIEMDGVGVECSVGECRGDDRQADEGRNGNGNERRNEGG